MIISFGSIIEQIAQRARVAQEKVKDAERFLNRRGEL